MQIKTLQMVKADEGKVIHQISKDIYAVSILLSETDVLDDFEEVDAPVEQEPNFDEDETV